MKPADQPLMQPENSKTARRESVRRWRPSKLPYPTWTVMMRRVERGGYRITSPDVSVAVGKLQRCRSLWDIIAIEAPLVIRIGRLPRLLRRRKP